MKIGPCKQFGPGPGRRRSRRRQRETYVSLRWPDCSRRYPPLRNGHGARASSLVLLAPGGALTAVTGPASHSLEHGRLQAGFTTSDPYSDHVFPGGFLNFDAGSNLTRIDTTSEKYPDGKLRPQGDPASQSTPGARFYEGRAS